MKLLTDSVKFETETGIVLLTIVNGDRYGFEWISGYNNGTHNPVSFSSFDAAYGEIKRLNSNGVKEMKYEGII